MAVPILLCLSETMKEKIYYGFRSKHVDAHFGLRPLSHSAADVGLGVFEGGQS